MSHPVEGERRAHGRGEQLSGKYAQVDPLPKNAVARLGTIRLRQIQQTVSVAFSPDGKYIASGTYSTCEVRLWEVATGKEVALVYSPDGPQSSTQRVIFSPDGQYLSYVGKVGRAAHEVAIKLWNVSSTRTSSLPCAISQFAFSPDSKLIAGKIDGELVIFNVKTRAIDRRLRRIEHSMHALAFSPDGKLLAVSEGRDVVGGEHPSTIRLWDLGTGKQVGEWVAHHRNTDSLCFSRDSKVLVSGGIGGVHIWDVASHRRLATIEDDGGIVAFSPNGKLLAVGGCSNEVHLWNSATHKRVRVIHPRGGWVRCFAFSPDGQKFVTGGSEHALQLWDVETGRQLPPVSGHKDSVFSVQFAPDGKTLASYGADPPVRLWDLSSAREQRRFLLEGRGGLFFTPGSLVPACSLAFSPDGKTLAAIGVPKEGEANNPVPLWNVKSGDRIAVIQTPSPKRGFYRPIGIAFSPDGQALATVNRGGSIQLWSALSTASLRLFPAPRRHPFRSLAFSPDGRTLAASQLDPDQIQLWDWTTGRPIRAFPCQKAGADYIGFSPSGQMLATIGPGDSTIQLHEPATGTLLRTLDGQKTCAACVVFSPNGRLLASAGQHDRTVRIWDVFTGKELAKFTGHRGPVYCVAFSPDGKTVASGSADTTILLWDVSKLQPEQPPAIARKELAHTLPRLWAEMQAQESAKAYRAIWKMLAAGDEAVAFLARKLHPVAFPDVKLLKQALADLDSNDFKKREVGTAHLTKLGELAEPAMRQALQAQPSLEMRKRIERILAEMPLSTSTEELRQIRAVHALELIGTPATRDLLKKLAGGAPGARLTRDAKLAVQRLERRTNKP
jgi:WD40 repeat protein